jgi:Leucine-rich repeat (LRR) protein
VQEFKRWKNTISSVTEIGAPICTHALLNRATCKHLIHLHLGLYGDVEKDTDRRKFIAKLKQAPNLTHLFIDFAQLTTKDFEKLLNNAPNLKTLICKDVNFVFSRIVEEGIGAPSHLETLMVSGGGYGGNALSAVR